MSCEHISVLLVDDRHLARSALRGMLESQDEIVVAGEAADIDGTLRQTRDLDVDIVLIDALTRELCPIALTSEVVEDGKHPPIVVLSNDVDDQAIKIVAAGADGLVLNSVRTEDLVPALKVVAAGYLVLPHQAPSALRARHAGATSADGQARARLLDTLTDRERDVLLLLALGLTNQEISDKLVLSESTVKSHVQHMLNKLNLPNRVHAVIFAYELGLVQVGQQRHHHMALG